MKIKRIKIYTEFEMGVRIRYIKDETGRYDTDFSIDDKNQKIILSDWELSKHAKENYGDSDVEYFYYIPLNELDKILEYFRMNDFSKSKIIDLDSEQKSYYSKIQSLKIQNFFLYSHKLIKNSSAASFCKDIENKLNIKINSSFF